MTFGWAAAAVAWVLVYELGRRRLARTGRAWPDWRRGCWWMAGGLLVLVGCPPVAGAAPDALWGESLQFALLAFGVGPLAALAAPIEPVGSLWGRSPRAGAPTSVGSGWLALGAFLVTTIGWRLPPAVGTAGAGGGWLVVEAVTVLVGTWPLWAALMGSPPREALAAPARRMVLSAFAAWSVWVFAYVVGFSAHAFYPAYSSGLTPAGSQQWVVAILWATSAAALVPVAFTNLVRWLAREQSAAAAEEADYRRLRALMTGHEAPQRPA